ncbi:MAG TPA: hypothetical protein PLL78_11785 [Fimbriimonadaceae bacterium]|nr:hypothetical protein [Fimbriimonadaceae bacterium]HRJ97355.1 hypothetical protein [Fimbriimonadaceae bacterium]
MHKSARSILVLWTTLIAVLAGGQPAKDVSLERQGAVDLLARIRKGAKDAAGESFEIGEHPFHFVFLVDSSRAASKSPETLFARNLIGQFLQTVVANEDARNVAIESRSLASVYPYQLDLYPAEAVKALEVTKENLSRITDGVPQTNFKTRPDGKPYVHDPANRKYDGHDNVQPRKDLLGSLGVETRGRPVVVVQITTNPLNEAPTNPRLDEEIRKRQARTGLLEGTGFRPYGDMQLASRHSPDATQVHFWAYGPEPAQWGEKLNAGLIKHPARGSTSAVRPTPPACPVGTYWDPEKRRCVPFAKPSALPWVIGILLVAGLLGGLVWWMGGRAQVVVEGMPTTLRRGRDLSIVGTGADKAPNSIQLPASKAAGAPAGTLAVLRYVGSEVQIEGRTCMVSLGGGQPKSTITLKKGPNGNMVTLGVREGFTTTLNIKIL